MATPRASKHRDLEQRLDDLETKGRRYSTTILRLPGRGGSATEFLNTDTFTATGPGDWTVTLSRVPMVGSEHVYLGGVPQAPDTWTRTGDSLTLLDPDSLIESGWKLVVAYAIDSFTNPAPPPPDPPGDGYHLVVLGHGPVWYGRLGESSGSIMVDSSGFGRDGTYTNVTLGAPALVGDTDDTAATFGSPSKGEVPYGSWATSQILSITGWIELADTTGAHTILSRHSDPQSSFNFRTNGTALQFVGWTGPSIGAAVTASTATLTAGVRYHVGVRVASNTVEFFVNGVYAGTGSLTGTVYQGTSPLRVGAWESGDAFAGVLDDVALFDRFLTDDEFADEYAAGV